MDGAGDQKLAHGDDATVAAALIDHAATVGQRLLLVARLEPAYCCSAANSFAPLEAAAEPRYAALYSAPSAALLSAPLATVQAAMELKAEGNTLDPPALRPIELGGALVLRTEVGTVAQELLRPSPRFTSLLLGLAGPIVHTTPAAERLSAVLRQESLRVTSSTALAQRLVGSSTGLIQKLRGFATGRSTKRERRRKAPPPEPLPSRLLEQLPPADIEAHLQLAKAWIAHARTRGGQIAYAGREDLDALEAETLLALGLREPEQEGAKPELGAVLDRWKAAAVAATPPKPDQQERAAALEAAAQLRTAVSAWLGAIREADLRAFASGAGPLPPLPPAPPAALRSLLSTLDPRGQLAVESVVFALQSGSAMYNLAVAASDEDYLLVYALPPGELLSFEPPADAIEFKAPASNQPFGADKGGVVEGSAMELGRWVALMCKGNPIQLEPLFVGAEGGAPPLHTSWVWGELQALAKRCLFTKRAVSQYIGFVEDRLSKAGRALDEAEPALRAASKFLYHAMHKLSQLRSIAAGDVPRIWLAEGGDDSDHARIMRVRKCAAGDSQADGELPGLRALQTLRTALESARRELDALRGDGPLGRREESLPAEVDFGALSEWLLSVRARMCRVGGEDATEAAAEGSPVVVPSAPALLPRQLSGSSADDNERDQDPEPDEEDQGDVDEQEDDDDIMEEVEKGSESQSAWQQRVQSILSQYQREENVRLIFAAERSSRCFGWSHANSDHDIVAIFICQQREYFRLSAPRRSVHRVYGADTPSEVDIVGWELKHACTLALGSNPSLLEALASPAVYVNLLPAESAGAEPAVGWGGRMLEIARRTYDRRALAGSYLSHGKSDLREQVQRAADGRPKRKKLFTVLRALLSTEHFHRMGALPTFQPDPGSEPEPEPEPGSEPELEPESAWPPLDLRVLLERVPDATLPPASREVLSAWLSKDSLARGLPAERIDRADPECAELERAILALIATLEPLVQAALPPKRWRGKAAAAVVEREESRREAAQRAWEGLCVEVLEAETALF